MVGNINLAIKKNPDYAESSITIVGLTREAYGRPQYFLVNSDQGENPKLKFPGLRFRAPRSKDDRLEDVVRERFEEQTGLHVARDLGLLATLPTRTRQYDQWMFRSIFFVVVEDICQIKNPDRSRKVYLADPGQGRIGENDCVIELMHAGKKIPLEWVSKDNQIISQIATEVLYHFDWKNYSTNWYKRLPCVSAEPLVEKSVGVLGCGLAVASMMLIYQPSVNEQMSIILLKRKGDRYPGYGGGKIETLTTAHSPNVDPISCCSEEGAQEYGFPIQPRALICCACTTLDVPDPEGYYNSIVNYSFVAEPTNLRKVEDALKNPDNYLEENMESYVLESLDEHRDRILRKELRMPDMISIGEQFYATTPGEKIPLTHFRSSGIK